MINKKNNKQFYGATTLGEKGQIVIPAEARKAIELNHGDKLLVFGMGNGMLTLAKLSEFAKFETHLASQLKTIRKIINNS